VKTKHQSIETERNTRVRKRYIFFLKTDFAAESWLRFRLGMTFYL